MLNVLISSVNKGNYQSRGYPDDMSIIWLRTSGEGVLSLAWWQRWQQPRRQCDSSKAAMIAKTAQPKNQTKFQHTSTEHQHFVLVVVKKWLLNAAKNISSPEALEWELYWLWRGLILQHEISSNHQSPAEVMFLMVDGPVLWMQVNKFTFTKAVKSLLMDDGWSRNAQLQCQRESVLLFWRG